jgi:hypothetical protein
MATTGFWPVKGRLKEVIDYANNPDKTTAKEYLDEDLYAAIRYVENNDNLLDAKSINQELKTFEAFVLFGEEGKMCEIQKVKFKGRCKNENIIN